MNSPYQINQTIHGNFDVHLFIDLDQVSLDKFNADAQMLLDELRSAIASTLRIKQAAEV